jgi:integrase
MSVSSFPSLIQRFFTDRLLKQLGASQYTVAAYRDAFRLLLQFACARLGRSPSELLMEDLDVPFLGQFLEHLELDRGNCTRTRNNRLAAMHAFFQYVAISEPALALQCQRVLAIPSKRYERGPVEFLTEEETTALVEAPNPDTWRTWSSALALTSVASEKGERCDAPRYARTSLRSSRNGYRSRAERRPIPSFPVRMEGASAPTHSSDSSHDISQPRVGLVRR